MSKLISFKNVLFIAAVFVILYSCTKDFEFDKLSTDNLSGEWAFPLINASIDLEDILNDTTGSIVTGEDGFVTLIYESDNLISMDGHERTIIPDQYKVLTEVFEIPELPSGITADIPLTFDFQFEMVDEDHRIDTMYFKNGEYVIGFSTNLNKEDADITMLVSNFVHKVTGEELEITFSVDNPNGQEISMTTSIDLSEYYVQFDNSIQNNKVFIDANIHLVTDDNANNSPYHIDITNEFNNLEFDRFFGFIGENQESYSDTVDIGIFNSTNFSNLEFGEGSVKLNLEVYNSLGMPIKLDVSQIRAFNTVDYSNSIEINIDPNVVDINYPTATHFNEYELTEINTNNVNINEIINISPDKLLIKVDGFLNSGTSEETVNYFADNSNLYVDASMELQLFGGVGAFEIVDTLDFDPASFEGFDAIEFMVEITNSFPINADIQLEFVDENFNVIYALVPENERLIQSGIVGPAPKYKVTSPTVKKTFIPLDRDGMDLIEQSNKILFTSVLSTENSQLVKIYADCNIQLQLGAKVIYIY